MSAGANLLNDPNSLRFCDWTGNLYQELGTMPGVPHRYVFQADGGIRDCKVTGVQTCALPICAFGLHHQGDGLLVVRVEMPVHRVGVHEDQVALLPVVTLVVVDLVARALEDVEGGLVLVPVTDRKSVV